MTCPRPSWLAPACRQGRCEAIDVRTDELGACARDTDCTLRWGANCCETCNGPTTGEGLVAVSNQYVATQCGTDPVPCDNCNVTPVPQNASAICDAGHCSLRMTP